MKLNKKHKYWEFYFDEDNDENTYPTDYDRQCLASIWSDEWRGLELLKFTDEELRKHLLMDIDDKKKYTMEVVSKGLIKHAINELKKIKVELNL